MPCTCCNLLCTFSRALLAMLCRLRSRCQHRLCRLHTMCQQHRCEHTIWLQSMHLPVVDHPAANNAHTWQTTYACSTVADQAELHHFSTLYLSVAGSGASYMAAAAAAEEECSQRACPSRPRRPCLAFRTCSRHSTPHPITSIHKCYQAGPHRTGEAKADIAAPHWVQ